MTYGEVFKQFCMVTGIQESDVMDYRPCEPLYGVPRVLGAIIVWLKNGDKLIYIRKEEIV